MKCLSRIKMFPDFIKYAISPWITVIPILATIAIVPGCKVAAFNTGSGLLVTNVRVIIALAHLRKIHKITV